MATRFVDASVFVHAYLRPKRTLKSHEREIKTGAKAIVSRINEGEAVVTSVVHFAETANLLEGWMPAADAREVQAGLLGRGTMRILAVERTDLLEALSLGTEVGVGTSDALAAGLMEREGIREVYSFDRDFDRIPGIRRVAR